MFTVSTVKFPFWSKQWIGGTWKEGSSSRYETVTNPFNQEVLAEIKLASKDDIDQAYQFAKQVQPAWANASAYERASVLERAAEILGQRKEEIINYLVQETGSSQLKASIEVDTSIGDLKYAAQYSFRLNGTILPSLIPGKENRVYRKPVGVIGAITPWNWPFYLSIRVIAPAIATGNSIVLKADSQTPITGGLLIAQIFEQAGLPKGVLSVVVADVQEIGDYMVEHPIPSVISFTGSTAAGRRIGEIAGRTLRKAALELGGNNVFIVLDDANIDQAVAAATFGKFLHQGQICIATNRIIVCRSVYEEFVTKFKASTMKVKVGDPADPQTLIGPLINQRQAQRIMDLIQQSLREGAKLELEGKLDGNLMTPFILTDVTNDMAIAKHEIFGPVAAILPVDNEDEAIRIANDCDTGLSGAVFSGSIEHGVHVAQQVVTGMIHVNDQTVNVEPNVPFGGEKSSGIGRYCGEWGIEEFTTLQWISVQKEDRQYPI
ncbi:putative aldehyde dehydrogenase YfmT [Alicyclobacillus acidoterrestris]|uniref:aldehyde dehydrogenase family protein n=1 Tax=Alicyclobacillus suci TaxID=2816080 RepID=UPI0011919622|nr:aldehyde dehydrogenase family protein [Alicyclobacillus suci]GEO27891.1 putative aldehyde dehydrogenase YfmT [Alicyclobacillus acidoterrestris]